ncbi:MAG TPA: hypothetical protein VGN57_11445 [Pirellulaceae bacterium]|jgi:hypothetical protein|nr:hypothetical protein [Pirellulaceae bacterium]
MSRPGLLRFSRFGLSSLFATMLLCISVAGWWRYERQIDAKEQAAIDAMAAEGIGLRITRRSASLRPGESTDAAAEEEPPGLLEVAWDQVFSPRDPIVTLMAEQIPSEETQRKLLDVPQLEKLWIFGNVQPKPGETYPDPPTMEEMLGRPLPPLPPTVPVPDEPPPLPQGTPLDEAERKQVLEKIAAAWKKEMERPFEEAMLYVYSDEGYGAIRVSVGSGARQARLERRNDEDSGSLSLRISIVGDDPAVAVQRRWETGKWRLGFAARSFDEDPISGISGHVPPEEKHAFLGQVFGQEFIPEESIGGIGRLEEGAFLLRRVPGNFVSVDGYSGMVQDGWIVVGPAPAYEIRRSDVRLTLSFVPGDVRRTDLFEHRNRMGKPRPLRQMTWLRQTAGYESDEKPAPETVTKCLTRYGWEFDPELPPDFFSPSRGGEFFTSQPPPAFRWWYFTGALAVLAYLAIGIANLRRLTTKRRETVA